MKQIFQDENGQMSSMRVMMMLLMLMTLFVIAWQVIHDSVDHTLIFELLSLALFGKLFQKSQETKKPQ